MTAQAIWVVYALAFVGALWIGRSIIGPLIWAVLYATGYAVFVVRAAKAGGRVRLREYPRGIAGAWIYGLSQAVTFPADEVSIGKLRWVPLFGYFGFTKDKP